MLKLFEGEGGCKWVQVCGEFNKILWGGRGKAFEGEQQDLVKNAAYLSSYRAGDSRSSQSSAAPSSNRVGEFRRDVVNCLKVGVGG